MPAPKKENPAAFKHWFNADLLSRIGQSLKAVWPEFDEKKFSKIQSQFHELEMKPRVLLIRDALQEQLPSDYLKALEILLRSLKSETLKGFDLWPYTEYIQTHGLNEVDASLEALHQLTKRFTSEFAVRPFLIHHPRKTFSQLKKWSRDTHPHVRRWTSEGSRPRLPWGAKLKASIQDPRLGLEILEQLKFDDELYVRKSVANHLNDIAKDHPRLVIETLKRWQKKVGKKHQDKLLWIQKQALRTLIKQGHPGALQLMGFGEKAKIHLGSFKLNQKTFSENEILSFELLITSKSRKSQRLAVDYIVHYQKANQKTSPKVFKLKILELEPGQSLVIKKNHSLKPVTTRKHYPGLHRLEIQINGTICASTNWTLKL
jgi:3-methyladenine DNA glycosylase AlkC